MRRILLTVALSVGLAAPSAAQGLKVAFHDGLVSVDATSVPVRTILTEWGKVGGTQIIGAERIASMPLTVKLVDVTEAKALETILRSVAGYMAASRKSGTGASRYDRILVMATTSAPATASASRPTPQQNPAFAGTQRPVPPPQRAEQREPDEQDEPDENPPSPPVFTFPQPGQQPGSITSPNGQPGTFTVNPQTGAPQSITVSPAQPGQPMMPAGVSTPGMILPAPAQQPATPGQIRPPGRN